ncbi:hypothetical protein RFI_32031, partial [Reticulomyxa filosa]
MVVVEKESFVVCCENGGLPSHNTLSSLQFFKITHHNIAPICLDTAKSMMVLMGRRTRVPTTSFFFETLKKKKFHLPFFFELKKKKSNATILEGTFVESIDGHDFLIEDVLMYSGKLLINETLSQRFEKIQQIVKIFRGLKMQREKDKINNKHSKFAFDFRGKHYGKNVVTADERENRYLEKFWDGL